jgi:LAO/AO transport system kinase
MVDFFLLLLLPGAGDELQGIKRGIVEMADLIAVNKADGERKALADEARRAYKNALHLFPPQESGWTPPVLNCSAELQQGMEDILEEIHRYRDTTRKNGYFAEKRRRQAHFWLYESIQEQLRQQFFEHPRVQALLPEVEAAVLEGRWSSFRGADYLLEQFQSNSL